MFEYAKTRGMDWGVIGSMPEIVGIALRFDGHMGFYVGGGYAVEWRGFNFGCVKTKVAGRGWTHWCKLPFINYDNSAVTIPTTPSIALGSRLLKKGMSGDDVKVLQELLLKLGYDLGSYGADGEFGAATEKAVMAFQRRNNLTADGKYGDKTHAALMFVTADDVHGREEEKEEIPGLKTGKTVLIMVENNGSVNVRVGNGTNYALITTVHDGVKLPYIAMAENGWYAVIIGSQVGWVSGKYAKTE